MLDEEGNADGCLLQRKLGSDNQNMSEYDVILVLGFAIGHDVWLLTAFLGNQLHFYPH